MTAHASTLRRAGTSSVVETRIFAETHLTMLAAIRTVRALPDAPDAVPMAKAEMAAAQAAHDVLIAVWPEGTARFDQQLERNLHDLPYVSATQEGCRIGAAAAARSVSALQLAGCLSHGSRMTAGFREPAAEDPWLRLPPVSLKRRDQFRAGDPGSDDATFARLSFRRSKAVARLMDRKNASAWPQVVAGWSGDTTCRWNHIASELARGGEPGSLLDHARLFAALNAALADAVVATRAAREFYGTTRSDFTANPHMFQVIDGYPAIVRTARPAVPNFPSERATQCGAAAAVLESFFGNHAALPASTTHLHRCIADAAKECAVTGLLEGSDFAEACTLGYDLGHRVGRWIVKHPAFDPRE